MNDIQHDKLDLSVVVPTRNASALVETCLKSVRRNRPGEIIVVDGMSRDATVELARPFADVILSDDGMGVAQARQLGAESARHPYVAFVDVDVELPDQALGGLLAELVEQGADGVQAQLVSVHSDDYWSRALASHHNRGRSRRWLGFSCTVFRRDFIRQHGFDAAFRTGEDIELRHRLQEAKARISVSDNVVVEHRFERGFRFALNQWLADGAGLGRMVRKHGWRVSALLLMPAAGGLLGVGRSFRREAAFLPYYVLYVVFNYVGICRGLLDRKVNRQRRLKTP